MTDKNENDKKEHIRRKYAFAYYKLKKYIPTAIERNEKFLKEQKLENNEHNLTAVQTMTYQAVLNYCLKMEKDYDENGPQNL